MAGQLDAGSTSASAASSAAAKAAIIAGQRPFRFGLVNLRKALEESHLELAKGARAEGDEAGRERRRAEPR
eukprot:11162238-Lingulodinium_polyedra.AAC.1